MDFNAKVQAAIKILQNGRMVILVDDEDRENEGDLVFPAECITHEIMLFMIKNGSGIVCLPLAPEYAERLNLPPMVISNKSRYGTPFTVSIEAKEGVSTGVSVQDRVTTILTAAADNATADDLVSPGHIFPLKAEQEGVLARAGHTEGSVDLVKLAGFKPMAVLCEVMNPDGSMSKGKDLINFSAKHDIPILAIKDLIAYQRHTNSTVE